MNEQHGPRASPDLARLVFVGALVVAGPVILALNQGQWFFLDEWSFLYERDGGSFTSVVSPHWGHSTVLPVLLYRALFNLVGLSSYLPYQVPVVLAHLALAAVLRTLLRRSGAEGWLATTAAVAFLFLGSGRSNLAWGFQITLTGSLATGFGALALVTATGPGADRARRHAAASALLVVSVLCSNVGLVMVGIVGAGAALRLGWRRALLVVGAPAITYVGWLLVAPESQRQVEGADPASALRFAAKTLTGSLVGLSTWWPLTLVMVAVVVLGAVRLAPDLRARVRHDLAAATVLAVAFPATALALGRARGVADEQAPTASRYVYLLVALALVPVVVLLQEAVRGRSRHARLAVLALVALWIPGNLARVGPTTDAEQARLGSRTMMIYMAETAHELDLPLADEVLPHITVGMLIDLRERGELPQVAPGLDDQPVRDRAEVALSIRISDAEPGACRTVDPSAPMELDDGQLLYAPGPQWVTLVRNGEAGGSVLWLTETEGTELVEVHRRIRVQITPLDGAPAELCETAEPDR